MQMFSVSVVRTGQGDPRNWETRYENDKIFFVLTDFLPVCNFFQCRGKTWKTGGQAVVSVYRKESKLKTPYKS